MGLCAFILTSELWLLVKVIKTIEEAPYAWGGPKSGQISWVGHLYTCLDT